jgi:hypothetical protein
MLCSLVFHSGNATISPALLSRAVPVTSVRLVYTFFVLIPAFVSFAAIGLPFFLRTLRSALKGRLEKGPRRGLVLLGISIALAAIELHFGRSGLMAVSGMALIGFVCGFRTVAGVGQSHGFHLLAAAGPALAVLAWYERRVLQGIDAEVALAPTALVAAGFFSAAGLITATAGVMQRGREGRFRLAACWIAALAWVSPPLVRSRLTESPLLADRIELAGLAAAAVLLTAFSMLRPKTPVFRS